MGMKSELRRRLSKTEGRLRREGRRLASVFLCGALIVGNLSAVPVSVLADDDNDYIYEIGKTALQEALQTAVSEGNTVSEDLEFAGEHAEEYAELFEADGTLYELELSDEEIDEDDDRDKALDLRIFARIDGDIPVDETYEIDGSEEIVFLVSNKTEKTATATISVDGLETDVITILPVDSIAVEEESTAVENTALTTTISRSVSSGGSGGGSGSSSASASEKAAEIESTEEETVIEITSAADNDEEESASITEDSKVTVVSGEDDSNIAEDETDTSAEDQAEEEDASEDQEITEDVSGNTETENTNTENTGAEDAETGDTDGDVNNTGTEEAGTSDSGAVSGNTGNTENDNKNENTSNTETSDNTSTEGGEENSTSDTDTASGNGNTADNVSDNTGDTGNTSGNSSNSSDITEDSDVEVLGSAISIRKSVLLAASIATDSDADETASASDADNAVDGIVYESVRFEKKGAAAFVTTAADLKLDEIEETESEESVEYTAEADGVSVTVTAPEGALPEDVVLSVTVYEEDSDEYAAAAEAIDYTLEDSATVVSDEDTAEVASEESTEDTSSASTGLAVLDISFLVDGEEVEPTEAVTVSIDASGIVPEDADTSTIEVQHLTESGDEVEATLVADAEDLSNGTVDADSVVAEFEVESFSTFTITWSISEAGHTTSTSIEATAYLYGTTDETISDDNISLTGSSGTPFDLTSSNKELEVDGYTLVSASVTYNDSTHDNVTAVTVTITDDRGNKTYTYSYTDSEGTTQLYSGRNETTVTVALYYTENAGITISAAGNDAEGYTLTATTAGSYTYTDKTWSISNTSSVAELTTNDDGTVTVKWTDDAESGDTVTVTVTSTYEDSNGVTQTVTDTYTLTNGTVAVKITVTYNSATVSGASVVLLDSNGNEVATGTTGSNGTLTVYVLPGTYYVIANYTNGSSSYAKTTDTFTVGDNGYSTTVALESVNTANHIDIKLTGSITVTINGEEQTINVYAYENSVGIIAPDGTDYGTAGTLQETEQDDTTYEYEYRSNAQISLAWDSDAGASLFTLYGYVLVSESDLKSMATSLGITLDELLEILGIDEKVKLESDVTLTTGSGPNGGESSTVTVIQAGTYYKLTFDDYHPTENVCGEKDNGRGYDFVLDFSTALSYLTNELMVKKYVISIGEDGKYVVDEADTTEFTFKLTKADDKSVTDSATLQSGDSHLFTDIESGWYYIEEDEASEYIPVSVDEDGYVAKSGYIQYVQSAEKESGEIPTVTFYNMKTSTIGIVGLTKEVNGSQASSYSDGTFTFYLYNSGIGAIELTNGETKQYYLQPGSYTIIEAASILTDGDSQTVTISGQSITMTKVTLSEDNDYGLAAGDYYISDTQVAINAGETLSYTITNTYTSGVELPETGGSGTTPFRIAGLLLTSCSAYLLYETLKRRRNYLR